MFIAHALCEAPRHPARHRLKCVHTLFNLCIGLVLVEHKNTIAVRLRRIRVTLTKAIVERSVATERRDHQHETIANPDPDTQMTLLMPSRTTFPKKRCTVCMQCRRKPHVNCKTRKTECHITPLPQNPSSRRAELNKIITVTRSSSLSGQGCFRKTTTRVTLCRRCKLCFQKQRCDVDTR